MSSIFCTRRSYLRSDVAVKANHIGDASLGSVARARKIIQRVAVVLSAASLAACAQSSVVSQNTGSAAASRQASQQHDRTPTTRRVASAKHSPFAPRKTAAETPVASQGIASFYWQGTRTASGEKFNTYDLTAAHPTLPFGTKLRVTNVSTGRSVMVRVNDRGPYVAGRVVDVSYSAANALGMVDKGLASVKLDVVH